MLTMYRCAAAPGADAELIAECRAFMAKYSEFERLANGTPSVGAEARMNEIFVPGEDFQSVLFDLPPAQSLAGLRAKAEAALAGFYPDFEESSALVLAEVVRDLLRLTAALGAVPALV